VAHTLIKGTDFKANLALRDLARAAMREGRAVEAELFRPAAGEDRPLTALPEVLPHA
jgi:hypothetical protein